MNKHIYRYAEKCLYSYRKNLSLLEGFSNELEILRSCGDVHAQDYSGRINSSAGNADPIHGYVHKILTLERKIESLIRRTKPITCLHEYLQSSLDTMHKHYLRILELYYFAHIPITRIIEITRWNRSTFYSRRYSLVCIAVSYFIKRES